MVQWWMVVETHHQPQLMIVVVGRTAEQPFSSMCGEGRGFNGVMWLMIWIENERKWTTWAESINWLLTIPCHWGNMESKWQTHRRLVWKMIWAQIEWRIGWVLKENEQTNGVGGELGVLIEFWRGGYNGMVVLIPFCVRVTVDSEAIERRTQQNTLFDASIAIRDSTS